MRRPVIWLLRGLVVVGLAAAVFDPHLAAGRAPTLRVFVVDTSESVRASGAAESLTVRDALRIVALEVAASSPDDRAAVVFAAARPVIAVPPTARRDFRRPEPSGDPLGTDLEAALEAAVALARGGDVVLLSDGRAAARAALLRAAADRVPIHALPIGPLEPVDVRIAGVRIPPSVPPGAPYEARVTLEATAAASGRLLAGSIERPFLFAGPGRQDFVLEGLRGAVELRLEPEDACPANGRVSIDVLEQSDEPRILLLTDAPLSLEGHRGWSDPARFDVIVLGGHVLDPEQMTAVASAVRAGAGLVLLGGPRSYAAGGWAGTPLEEVSPLWAFPDERSAVVVVFDGSASMQGSIDPGGRRRIDAAAAAVARALPMVRDDDQLAVVRIPDGVPFRLGPGRERGAVAETLRRIEPSGATALAGPLMEALRELEGATAGKRRILLVSDGETTEDDAILRVAGERLRSAGASLTVVATGPKPDKLALLGGELLDGSDWDRLDQVVAAALARSQEIVLAPASATGLPRPALMNRTTAKPTAEVVARGDGAPLLAYGLAGRGRVAAATFAFDRAWIGELAGWDGLAAVIRRVAPTGTSGLRVAAEIEGGELIVRATMTESESMPDVVEASIGGRPLVLRRSGAASYEGRAPALPGAHVIRVGGRPVAAAVQPSEPELARVGVDRATLERIARETGGRFVGSLPELPARVVARGRLALRPWLLAAALALFLAEAAVRTFWRQDPSGPRVIR